MMVADDEEEEEVDNEMGGLWVRPLGVLSLQVSLTFPPLALALARSHAGPAVLLLPRARGLVGSDLLSEYGV